MVCKDKIRTRNISGYIRKEAVDCHTLYHVPRCPCYLPHASKRDSSPPPFSNPTWDSDGKKESPEISITNKEM